MNLQEVTWALLFSPYAQICEVDPQHVLQCIIELMQQWGFIKCFRFDNGRPLGDPKRERIMPLALQLIARGCEIKINSPRTPTQNAKVERCQGTTGRWADAKNCEHIEDFKKALKYAVTAQRERLPSRVCDNKPRIEYYPELLNNPKKFEPNDFDMQRVYQFLEKGRWYRKISKRGQIGIFGKTYYAGFKHLNLMASVQFKVIDSKPFWLITPEDQLDIIKIPADYISEKQYLNLSNFSKN